MRVMCRLLTKKALKQMLQGRDKIVDVVDFRSRRCHSSTNTTTTRRAPRAPAMVIGMEEMASTLGNLNSRNPLRYCTESTSRRQMMGEPAALWDRLGGGVGSPLFLAGCGIGARDVLKRWHLNGRRQAFGIHPIGYLDRAHKLNRVEGRNNYGPATGNDVLMLSHP